MYEFLGARLGVFGVGLLEVGKSFLQEVVHSVKTGTRRSCIPRW